MEISNFQSFFKLIFYAKKASLSLHIFFDLYAGCDLLVALGHNVDDVGPVRLQETHIRACDALRQGPVGFLILVNHGKHYEEVVLLGHAVDVAHAGIVKQLSMCVEARLALCAIQMTLHGGGS